ncbi:hypothetical protein [Micromonospora sp. NPDC051141]|uniref:hypothetical protein n=1 Tax=Micromonospora sp. NPDC051141 TaxID=3364284 RepID=UPI00378FB911
MRRPLALFALLIAFLAGLVGAEALAFASKPAVSAAPVTANLAEAASTAGDPSSFVPLSPSRVFDTKNLTESPAGALKAGETRPFGFSSCSCLKFGATAVALSVTVTSSTQSGSLLFFPFNGVKPIATTVSFAQGKKVSTGTIVKLGDAEAVAVFNSAGSTNITVDILGYFIPPKLYGPQGYIGWASIGGAGHVNAKFVPQVGGSATVIRVQLGKYRLEFGRMTTTAAAIQITARAPIGRAANCAVTGLPKLVAVNGSGVGLLSFDVVCKDSVSGVSLDSDFDVQVMA